MHPSSSILGWKPELSANPGLGCASAVVRMMQWSAQQLHTKSMFWWLVLQ